MTEHRPCPSIEFEPAPCAKCGPLWPVTERDTGNDLADRLEKVTLERIAKHILEQREGGHCGEGSMEIIQRQRNDADLKRAAEFVRLVPAPQVKP